MALIKAGVWHTTVWASRTWQEDLWLEYGTATPPTPPTPTVTIASNYYPTKHLPRHRNILAIIKQYLELKQNDEYN